jgi:5-formyltetrahydrofolate cyclo-ligase
VKDDGLGLAEDKALLRTEMSTRREAAHGLVKDAAPLALLAHAFPVKPHADRSTVSAFHPYQSEIDARPLLGKLAGEGWTTALPVVIKLGQPLEFRRWLPGEPTIAGKWGILRPTDEAPIVEPDVLLVPLLAFDRKGYRLGYGGGFYDRSIAGLASQKPIISIGLAYAAQEIDLVPHDDLDQRLDFVMTERDLISCA